MDGEIVEVENTVARYRDPAQQADAVLNLLATSIERGLAPEALEKLVALQERVMAKHAEASFNRAMAAFQAECPVIEKANTADTGKYKYKFADLPQIANTIRPFLDKHGLSYTFDSEMSEHTVAVICVISHIDGHSRPTRFACPIDTKAAMNDSQKFASATTYSRRYALTLALGLITGDDDDCRAAYEAPPRDDNAPRTPTRAQRQEVVTVAEVGDLVKAFKGEYPNAAPEDWSEFVERISGRKFNAKKAPEWTKADLDACWRALQGGG